MQFLSPWHSRPLCFLCLHLKRYHRTHKTGTLPASKQADCIRSTHTGLTSGIWCHDECVVRVAWQSRRLLSTKCRIISRTTTSRTYQTGDRAPGQSRILTELFRLICLLFFLQTTVSNYRLHPERPLHQSTSTHRLQNKIIIDCNFRRPRL